MTTDWWRRGVVYQIYPRSFMDSNGDGVGDLAGILHRIDYLASLGIDAIWISPIYPSPMADFGYDVADYTDIHPLFGDLETFDKLLAAAHDRGLKVILDWVPNHSSDEHPWFVESRSSKDNPKRDWYIWKDPKPDGSPPNNWGAFFGGRAWELDPTTGQYYLHLFHKKQPDLNWRNPEVVEAMHDTLRFWLDRGIDGFRMDVVTFIIKHQDFPDNPIQDNALWGEFAELANQEHKYNINQPEVHGYFREFRKIVDEYQAVSIGETWFFDPVEIAPYYGENLDELHIPFNFMLMKEAWNAVGMRENIRAYYAALPEGAQPNFVLGSHDEHRFATRYGYENHRSAALMLLTLRGTPTLYYGDELGMVDADIPVDKMVDPQGIGNNNPELSRDPERTPMQWDTSPNAGFSIPDAEPWLPIHPNYQEGITVADQESDPQSTLAFYRQLLSLRREHTALHTGDFAFIEISNDQIMAFTRQAEGETFATVINFGDTQQTVDLSDLGTALTVALSTQFHQRDLDAAAVVLAPHEGVLLRVG